jgi:hypothetical protein
MSDIIQREPNGRFLKGFSANPNGKSPVVREVQELARTHTVEAIETLCDIMRDPQQPGATRVAAATALLDRGYGRPPQAIAAEVTTRFAFELPLVELSEDEWLEANTLKLTRQ